ncbi:thyrotropin-releasing hormone receptor-like [Haliotis rufescens]|uniref:thyrotropin-releasing hormone receptor-like n=1 Tax=Haliotis rufescens TaxID=6454 RepID=UPI00201EFBB0|nr:thyrotropin-releasing hormone receptor-like [Haliotis rufescens]
MNNSSINGLNGEVEVENKALLLAGIYLNNYYLWVIFAIGFPGNCASVVTIIRMQKLTTSTFYVAFLAVADNLAIVQKLLYLQLTLHGVWIGSVGCKILNFLTLFLVTYSNWILVAMAVERFVAVKYPLKISVFWSIKRAYVSLIMLGVLMFGVYSHLFWTFTSGNGIDCGMFIEYVQFYRDIWYWISAAVYSIIPCILLLSLNVLIIRAIKISRQQRIEMSVESEKAQTTGKTVRQDRQITVMLMTVTFVFVILTVPRTIYVVVDLFWTVEYGTLEDAQKYLINQVTFFLCDSNHAINFYLYFITGRKFRRQFLDLCMCRKRKRQAQNVTKCHSVSCTTSVKAESRNGSRANRKFKPVAM